jgi:hypothetical protein
MKDFVGCELVLDDWVAAIRPNYRELVLGRIVAFTAKKVRVEYRLHFGNSTDTHLYWPTDLVRLEGPHLTMKLLKGE